MIPDINIWAVLVATLATMIIGSVWYSPPVFGTFWMRAARIDPEAAAAGGFRPIVVGIITGFITSWTLAGAISIAHEFYDGAFLSDALITAVLLWGGLAAARIVTHDAFEVRPPRLTLLTVSHELVTFLAIGLVIGLMGV